MQITKEKSQNARCLNFHSRNTKNGLNTNNWKSTERNQVTGMHCNSENVVEFSFPNDFSPYCKGWQCFVSATDYSTSSWRNRWSETAELWSECHRQSILGTNLGKTAEEPRRLSCIERIAWSKTLARWTCRRGRNFRSISQLRVAMVVLWMVSRLTSLREYRPLGRTRQPRILSPQQRFEAADRSKLRKPAALKSYATIEKCGDQWPPKKHKLHVVHAGSLSCLFQLSEALPSCFAEKRRGRLVWVHLEVKIRDKVFCDVARDSQFNFVRMIS